MSSTPSGSPRANHSSAVEMKERLRPGAKHVERTLRMKKKKVNLKLKRKEDLVDVIDEFRVQYSKFDDAYNHTLAYYFLSQYLSDRRLSHCFDFMNKVDVYRSLRVPTRKQARIAMHALKQVAFVQSQSRKNLHRKDCGPRAPENALPVDLVVKNLEADVLDSKAFDPCYDRIKEMLVSFYVPFLRSNHFLRFVQIMEYSRRKVFSNDLQSVAHLGQGAFGRVIAVEKKDTHALFAMKEIPKAVLRKHNTGWMCQNEMQLLARTRSPFVLNLKYSFHSERAVHLVFEMCMGGDLREYLEKSPFTLKRAIFYTAEILLGIDHIHSLEYAYRDLKPSNILLTQDGHCKISDLGLVVKLPKPPKILKHVAGTPGYWPPEIVARTGTYFASDYWSLGVLLYAMLYGRKIPDPLDKVRPKRKRRSTSSKSSRSSRHEKPPGDFKMWSPFASNPNEQNVAKKDPKYKNINATVDYPKNIPPVVKDFMSK
eukprot:1365757-Amorphochlora_amoeboformis.AAC.1